MVLLAGNYPVGAKFPDDTWVLQFAKGAVITTKGVRITSDQAVARKTSRRRIWRWANREKVQTTANNKVPSRYGYRQLILTPSISLE